MKNICHELLSALGEIPDPRRDRTKIYPLELILFIALCTFLTGGKSFYEMELFATTRKNWLKRVADMTSIPSHDTFNRIFQAISPDHFNDFLINITKRLRKKISGEIVAFDGKTHCGTASENASALHMLNAWAVQNRLVLGQLAVHEKSNEITAMPQLMDVLDLSDCIVTADALNCQKKIADKAVEKGADYVLAMKGNHQETYNEIKLFMDSLAQNTAPAIVTDYEKSHGRIEQRKFWISTEIEWLETRNEWTGLKSFCMVEAIRGDARGNGQTTTRRYYISSLCEIGKAAEAIRGHWGVENEFHWCLDVVFDEDKSRVRTRNAAKNLGILRGITMNLLKNNPEKTSLKGKMYQASMSISYLKKLLKI